jgi:hypothetical protein
MEKRQFKLDIQTKWILAFARMTKEGVSDDVRNVKIQQVTLKVRTHSS